MMRQCRCEKDRKRLKRHQNRQMERVKECKAVRFRERKRQRKSVQACKKRRAVSAVQ